MTFKEEFALVEKVCGKCRHYGDKDDTFCLKCNKVDREKKKLSHRQLCELGARFLNQDYTSYGWHILIETGYRAENPDVFAFTKYYSCLIECKASRSDFLADKKKPFRQNPQLGIGLRRFYLVNNGVATQEDMPEGWQLLIAYDKDTILMPEDYLPPSATDSDGKYSFDIRNATNETELMWSWLYRKEHKCLPVISSDSVNMIHPHYWKQGDKVVDDILKGLTPN